MKWLLLCTPAKRRVLNFYNHSTVMPPQSLFVLNVCFSHLAIYTRMEILFSSDLHCKLFSTVFQYLAYTEIICSTCKSADSFTLSPKRLIQKLQVGPSNLHLGLAPVMIWIGWSVDLALRISAVYGQCNIVSLPLIFCPLQISQNMHYSLT